MGDESFADFILGEKDWSKKLEIMYYLKKRAGIYYDNSVIFKTLLAKLFLEYLHRFYPKFEIDDNLVITARLLCDCQKIENSTSLEEIRNYAKRGAEYLAKLGFDERFCRICEGVNRYTITENRDPESDLLELVDQFGGMLLDRPERAGFKPDDALVLLEHRNLKDKNNRLLKPFVKFINYMQTIEVKNEQ